jgi:thiamine phosphate synthase YjbQ (UPF0047 family)
LIEKVVVEVVKLKTGNWVAIVLVEFDLSLHVQLLLGHWHFFLQLLGYY